MKVAIVCQEEPVFLGPFVREVVRMRPESIVGVAIAGRRGAGERRRTLAQRVGSLWIFWLIFEPVEFFRALWRRARARVLGPWDPLSVEGLARRLGIRVVHIMEARAAAVADAVRGLEPDVVLNQSEVLLDADVLALPSHGFVNRHASLLPAHRGRLGSFWAHAEEEPRHGVTIHMVDEGIDTGAILEQWEATQVDPAWSFPRVLRALNAHAPRLFWSAIDRLERGEAPKPQPEEPGQPPRRFPTLEEARRYRAVLASRRVGRSLNGGSAPRDPRC